MRRYVISAPRSGLNWLRFCALYFYGERTPDMPRIFSNMPGENEYVRSHDPYRASGNTSRAFFTIDPAETAGGSVMLLLRHPLETFVRDAERRFKRFARYPANIRFLTNSPAKHKGVFYYEDIVKDPAAMIRALEFLGVELAPGKEKPTVERMAAEWDAAAKASRESYNIRQSRSGGAVTKERPYDFTFHQRKLNAWRKYRVWRHLEKQLSPAEMRLLDRYSPAPSLLSLLPGQGARYSTQTNPDAVAPSTR